MKRDENEQRKEPTLSEKVRLAKRLKATIGNRKGRPKADSGGGELNGQDIAHLKEDDDGTVFDAPKTGKKTNDHVAKKSGIGNKETLRLAEKVVDAGDPELTALMDSGDLSVSAAAEVAELPQEKRKEVFGKILAGDSPKKAIEAAQVLAAPPEEPTVKDEMEAANRAIESFCRQLMALVKEKLPTDAWLNDDNTREGALQKFEHGCSMLRTQEMHSPLPDLQRRQDRREETLSFLSGHRAQFRNPNTTKWFDHDEPLRTTAPDPCAAQTAGARRTTNRSVSGTAASTACWTASSPAAARRPAPA